MIIFRTHPDHIDDVVRYSRHALSTMPRVSQGDLILISQTVAQSKDGSPPIRYVMEFVGVHTDDVGESRRIWGRDWRYIVNGRNCRPLKQPFDIRKIQVSGKNYGQGGPYVYVAEEDEAIIRKLGLLE